MQLFREIGGNNVPQENSASNCFKKKEAKKTKTRKKNV